jgi:hypothetical protein
VLIWFACPSLVFRQQYIFIPIASSSFFGFFGAVWALISSPRFIATSPSCPVTIVLTLVSAAVYGTLALFTRRKISQVSRTPAWPTRQVWQQEWQQDPYGHSYAPSPHLTAYPPAMQVLSSETNSMYQYAPSTMTEEEQINHQMSMLLTKADSGPSPDPTKATFRLEWPGGEEEEEEVTRRTRTFSFSGDRMSNSGPKNTRSGSVWNRVGKAVGIGGRDRPGVRQPPTRTERARSREERRVEIELATVKIPGVQ